MDHVIRPIAVSSAFPLPGRPVLGQGEIHLNPLRSSCRTRLMFLEFDRRLSRMQQMIGIHAVDDIHVVASLRQRVGEPVEIHGISAEVIGRIERRQMKKIERPAHSCETFPMTSRNCRAACSQVRDAAAAMPHSPIRRRSSADESTRSIAPPISAALGSI